jgi:tetratricopeptide (TPR) repeat protein
MRGSMQITNGDLELAEDSLRHSLRSARTPMTLNDLAWLVQKKGEYEDAEKFINEALAANSRHPSLWDTKGEIMLKMKKYDEAVESFGRSLLIFDKNPSVHLHMAEAQLALGHMDRAREITARINRIKEALPPDDREILGRLQMKIGGAR